MSKKGKARSEYVSLGRVPAGERDITVALKCKALREQVYGKQETDKTEVEIKNKKYELPLKIGNRSRLMVTKHPRTDEKILVWGEMLDRKQGDCYYWETYVHEGYLHEGSVIVDEDCVVGHSSYLILKGISMNVTDFRVQPDSYKRKGIGSLIMRINLRRAEKHNVASVCYPYPRGGKEKDFYTGLGMGEVELNGMPHFIGNLNAVLSSLYENKLEILWVDESIKELIK